jgi:hypothetical protein
MNKQRLTKYGKNKKYESLRIWQKRQDAIDGYAQFSIWELLVQKFLTKFANVFLSTTE